MEKLTELEIEVLNMLLDGDVEVLKLLKRQLSHITKVDREYTGVGFYTEISFDEERIQRTSSIPGVRSRFFISDVIGYINKEKTKVGFVAFIDEGLLSLIEGYTFIDEKWSEEIKQFELSYTSENERDFDKISRHWLKNVHE